MTQASTTQSSKSQLSLNSRGIVAEMLMLLVVFAGIAGGAYWYMNKEDNNADDDTIDISLPADAVQISTCIPGEGVHWVPLSNIPQGPYYVLNEEGEVRALEYMFLQEDIPGKDFAHLRPDEIPAYMQQNQLDMLALHNELGKLNLDMMDVPFESANVHWTVPHAGMPVPHIDIHFYLPGQSDGSSICPDADPLDSYAPEFIQKLLEQNIPLPGGSTERDAAH